MLPSNPATSSSSPTMQSSRPPIQRRSKTTTTTTTTSSSSLMQTSFNSWTSDNGITSNNNDPAQLFIKSQQHRAATPPPHHKLRRRSLAAVPLPSPVLRNLSSDHLLNHHVNNSSSSSSSSNLQSLDLSFSVSSSCSRLGNILQGSISEAMLKLQCLQAELHYSSGSSVTSSSTESTEGEGDDDEVNEDDTEDIAITSSDEADHPLTTEVTDEEEGEEQEKQEKEKQVQPQPSTTDNETLKAFLQEVYDLLSSIRRDVQEQMPNLSPAATNAASAAAALPGNTLEALATNFRRTQEILQHLALYSPLSINLPEFPASLSFLSSAAKEALVAASPAFPSTSSTTSSSSSSAAAAAADDDGVQVHPPNSPFKLPRPPIAAIRAYLASESAKLSAKLPSRPAFQDWPSNVSSALHDASHFVQDESERLKEFVSDEADRFKNALKAGATRLLDFHELPAEWRNNKYILSGYRFIPIDRPGELLLSGLKWHNETINIYSHFIPAAYIIYYIFFVFPHTPLGDPTINTIHDRAANITFLLASLACLLLSAAWHLAAGCGTFSVFRGCATLDYLGISALISTSIISLTHAAFRCSPATDLAYNLTTCVFGALGLYLPWKPWFNQRAYKNVRISFFVLLAGVGVAPVLHMVYLFGVRATWDFYSPVIYSLLAYKIGLIFYALDFPEVVRPGGLFDTLAHSHQFWHFAIVFAIALHWRALKRMNEAGLDGYSCQGRDPYEVQYLIDWFHHRRDEL